MTLKTKLQAHQIKAVEKLQGIKVGALYMEMGTGKTRTALELVKIRLDKEKINHVIWLCPCSVKTNLKKDLEKHSDNFNNLTITGIETLSSSIKANIKLLELTEKYNCFLIVDESNLVKNYYAMRTKNIIRIAEKCKYKLILNGTPISKCEKDLFAQWYILDYRIFGYQSFWSFAANHLEYDDKIPGKVRRTLNVEYLVRKMAPYTYQIKKSECLNLPEKTYDKIYYDMTESQRYHYGEVANKLMMELDDFKPETVYRFLTGLQNVISGLEVWEEKKHLKNKPFFKNQLKNPRIQTLLNVTEELNEKAIIFCKYTHEIKTILKILGDKAVGFYGELNQKERQKNIELFEKEKQFLVANKTCAGYGLNLQFCSYVIYYSNDWDYATRSQSEDRVHRIGQEKNVHYIDIVCNASLDEKIMDCLDRKYSLVESLKNEIEKQKDKKDLADLYVYYKKNGKIKLGKVIKETVNALEELKEKEMEKAFFTKNIKEKFEYINKEISAGDYSNVIYFCPKKYEKLAKENFKDAYIFHYEDINKTNKPYEVTNDNSLIILDGSARYKNITSYIFKRLEKLVLTCKNKIIVDIVPFTTDIMYSYVPFSHLKRQILGHQHWYAFRENNQEYNSKGELVPGHDFNLLAEKMSTVSKVSYPHFFESNKETIMCEITEEEQEEYNKYRDSLLDEYETIQPVLTRLADFVNTRQSRYKALHKLVSTLEGSTFVYTNIKSHNPAIKKLLKEFPNVKVKTFYDNNEDEFEADNIVLAEVPIVKNYLFLDVIANASKAKFYFITGYTTIDELLYNRMVDEFTQIDDFTRILSKKVKEWEKMQGEKSI